MMQSAGRGEHPKTTQTMTRYLLIWIVLWCNTHTIIAQDEPIGNDNTMSLTPVDTFSTDGNNIDCRRSVVCFTTDTVTEALPWPQNAQQALGELLDDKLLETSQMAMMVYDLTADSILFRHNERQMMRPASTMKLITAITALERLGGSHRYITRLKYTGTISEGTLHGNLYCVGGFDPMFNSDDMRAFVEGVKRLGIDTLRGTIVADKTMKNKELLGEGWCWDDENPVLSPLLYRERDSFTSEFITELLNHDVVVECTLSEGSTPSDAYEICNRFHTIDQVLMNMMKNSDNLYAEATFYQVAASTLNQPACAKDAATVIRRLLQKVMPREAPCRIADGSGLSLYNYVTVEHLVMLLRYAWKNNNIYLHLLPSLPIAGEDGTLRKRMKGTFAGSNVRAKTGAVTGVSALAGYLTAANGHTLCFSIINQGVTRTVHGRNFQDKVCNILCRP